MPKSIVFFLLFPVTAFSQKYTHADSLKGSYGPSRSWWDIVHYDLHVAFDPKDSTISGHNTITWKALKSGAGLQVDLMQPLTVDTILLGSLPCTYRRDGNAYFVSLPGPVPAGDTRQIRIVYHGRPVQARNAPWDGGVVWSRDKAGRDWISVACQGMAAQAWFPNKDHMADEVDSASMHFTVDDDQFVVSNGRLAGITRPAPGKATFTWKVKNPINNYNIIPYIGRYTVIKDTFNGVAGTLDIEFWALQEDVQEARRQFGQVKPMLRCFEHWFGRYPFYEDGYKLVQAPYLGMEHQSAIAYGNSFMNGYRGRDLSNTGWGLKWDFIIVHESGHEWFGNSISAADVADNWIHEGFTAYSENLYTEWLYGKTAGAEYVRGTRAAVLNDKPIISAYGVNAGGSLDLYYKAANMLHTIRQIVNNDDLWLKTLRGMNVEFYHRTVTTGQVEAYLKKTLGMDLQKVFDQYLRTTSIPVLEYELRNGKLRYRWTGCVRNFEMPVRVFEGSAAIRLNPTEKWKKVAYKETTLKVNPDYYLTVKSLD